MFKNAVFSMKHQNKMKHLYCYYSNLLGLACVLNVSAGIFMTFSDELDLWGHKTSLLSRWSSASYPDCLLNWDKNFKLT